MFDTLPLEDDRIFVRGALCVQRTSEGLTLRRLPLWTQSRTPQPAFELMAAMTSGVRLHFVTTAQICEVDLLETGLQFEGEPRRSAVVDLYSNGALQSQALRHGHTIVVGAEAIDFKPGQPQTLRFKLGSGGNVSDENEVELWLPQSATTQVCGLRLARGSRLAAPPPGGRRWLHYGSSISHGMEAAGPSRTWPAQVARKKGLDLVNLGLAGECHLDGFMARVIGEARADLVSLELGTNIVAADTLRRRTFAGAVHGFLDTIRFFNPKVPVLIVSPIYCAYVEETTGPLRRLPGGGYALQPRPHAHADGAMTLKETRQILAEVVAQRRREGDGALAYMDGLTLFGEKDADDLCDGVHPGANGHDTIAGRFFNHAFEEGLFAQAV